MSANAWTRNGQGVKNLPTSPQPIASSQPPAQPPFNAEEVRACLKSGFGAVAPEDKKSLAYKLGSHTNNARAGSAWTSPKNMSNGKDFYNELRKQVSTMEHNQQAGERAGG